MDKFQYDLKANEETVVFRQDNESSVIRRSVMNPSEVRDLQPGNNPEDNYCECGWPYQKFWEAIAELSELHREFIWYVEGDFDH